MKVKSKKTQQAKQVEESEIEGDYVKPSSKPAKNNTSDWPLLLKVRPTILCEFFSRCTTHRK